MWKFFKCWVPLMLFAIQGCGRSESDVQNIFGEDNRERITSLDYPFSALGKLNDSCTGVLIAKRLVLTAAHCVFDSSVQRPRESFNRFDLGLLNGQVSASARPVRAWIGSNQPEEVRSSDWAIVELDEELGVAHKYLKWTKVDFEKTLPYAVNLAGYNSDVNAGLTASVHWGCAVRKMANGRLMHDCDSTAGISGGPLFVSIDGDWRVVGISVSEFRNGSAPPVTRETWDEGYTNVGVPTSTFASIAGVLIQTVDNGNSAPNFKDAVLIDFSSGVTKPEQMPNPEAKPNNVPSNTVPAANPSQRPGQLPEPLQNPNSELSPDKPFARFQMVESWILMKRINRIQETHRALSQDSSVMMQIASSLGDSYLGAVTSHFQSKLNAGLYAWNSFSQCVVSMLPCQFDIDVLYNAYIGLKFAEIDLRHSVSKFSGFSFENMRAQEGLVFAHIRDLESALFWP